VAKASTEFVPSEDNPLFEINKIIEHKNRIETLDYLLRQKMDFKPVLEVIDIAKYLPRHQTFKKVKVLPL
jgi:hypothetical protein